MLNATSTSVLSASRLHVARERAVTNSVTRETMDKPWLQPISRSAPGEDMMGGLPECGDFKRGSCFRASCKFMHNGKPASEYQPEKGVTPGLPTPRAASHFEAPANLDINLYDPNTGFGLFGTHVFGTRYGTIGAIPKIENVRPLCMDFFKQGVCNRRGPHNQGCLFRHDEIDGRGKIVDESMVMKVDQLQVDLFVSESSGGVGVWGKYARDDLADAAAAYAKQRELQLQAEAAGAKRREEEDAHAAEAAKAVLAAAAAAGARPDGVSAHAAAGAASTEAPLPEGWKATKAPDGRVYYFHAATKKTTWTRPVADPADAPPLPVGWKQATAPDGRTYYFVKGGGGKTQWTRPTEPAPGAAPVTAPGAAPASAADAAAASADGACARGVGALTNGGAHAATDAADASTTSVNADPAAGSAAAAPTAEPAAASIAPYGANGYGVPPPGYPPPVMPPPVMPPGYGPPPGYPPMMAPPGYGMPPPGYPPPGMAPPPAYPPSGYPPSGYPSVVMGVPGPPPPAAPPPAAALPAAAHVVGAFPLSAAVPAETDAAAPPAEDVQEEADPDEPEAKRAKVDE